MLIPQIGFSSFVMTIRTMMQDVGIGFSNGLRHAAWRFSNLG